MSEMVERVAKAIWAATGESPWDAAPDWMKNDCRKEARAAIEAMRDVWRGLIDAALADTVTRIAWLGTEFGEQFARRQFGDAVVDALPRYTKGKKAGKHKASIEWIKIEQGGGVREGDEGRGQIIAARLVLTQWGSGEVEVLVSKGEAGRFEAEFRSAWETLKARITPEQLAATFKAMNIRDDD